LPPYEYDQANKIIVDNIKNEKWKILGESQYRDLTSEIRESSWQMQSADSIKQFISKIQHAYIDANIDETLIKLLREKFFWSNTKEISEQATIILHQNQAAEIWKSRTDTAYGLVKKILN